MTRIVVAAKQDKILLQDSQAKTVSLNQPAIIQNWCHTTRCENTRAIR